MEAFISFGVFEGRGSLNNRMYVHKHFTYYINLLHTYRFNFQGGLIG